MNVDQVSLYHPREGKDKMGNLSGVVQQLKRERERGDRRCRSDAEGREITAQRLVTSAHHVWSVCRANGQLWKPQREATDVCVTTQANDLSSGSQENRSRATRTLAEGQAQEQGSVNKRC